MISVVIPTLNEEKNIVTILNSLALQKIDEGIEVVIADAHSQDKTKEKALEFKKKFKNLLIVEGGLPAVGRNRGALASTGDPIFFIDADMVILEDDFLKKAVDYFRGKNLSIATTYLYPQSKKIIDHILIGIYNILLRPAKFIRPMGAMCIVASREMFERVGGYPEDVVMAEDHEFVNNCSKKGRYDIIPLYITMSVRRFDKEGRLKLLLKYLMATIHTLFKGPIKKPIFKYEFASYDKEKEV